MKVFIRENRENKETYTEIHCREQDAEVRKLQRYISSYAEKFACRSESGTVYVQANDIFYFETIDNKTFLYTRDEVYEIRKRLYELENVLNRKDFFRCSKAIIVNVTKIEKLRPDMTRNILAELSNGEAVVISRRYVNAFREMIYLEELK